MAPRIPVVFSQAAGLTPQQRDHEETLIAEMLMEDRIEVSLIGAMELLEQEDTDRLCLMGFQGDFILLSSLDSAAAFAELERLEVEGSQGKTMFEPTASLRADQTRRKIYHIPVVEQPRGEVRKEVQRLREDAQIATVPLLGIDGALAAPPAPPTVPPTVTPTAAKPTPAPAKSTPPPTAAPPTAAPPTAAPPTAATQSQASPAGFDEWEDDEVDSQLDSLVDELDDMDL